MATPTPIRRPLATLNSNHALTPQRSQNLSQAAKGTAKSAFVEKTLLPFTQNGEATGEVEQDGRLDGKKGHNSDDNYDLRAKKRQRRMEAVTGAPAQQHGEAQIGTVEGTLAKDEAFGNDAEIGHELENNEVSSSFLSPCLWIIRLTLCS